jgi:hypothetical protein
MLGGFALKIIRPTLGGSAFRSMLGGSALRPTPGGSALRPTLGSFALSIYFDQLVSQDSTSRTVNDVMYDFTEHVQCIITVYIKVWPKLLKDPDLLSAGHSH